MRPMMTLCAALLALSTPAVLAAPPANDDWAQRINIPLASLAAGFTDTQATIAEATVDSSDPILVCKNGDPQQRGNTVWYQLDLSGSSQPVFLNLSGLGYDSVVAVFTGSPGSFSPVLGGCNDDGGSGFASVLNGLRLAGDNNYSIVVARPAQNSNFASLSFSARNAPRYLVSKTEDTLDGSCNADCSLREAISANNGAPGAIELPAGDFILSRTGAGNENLNASGDLDLSAGAGIYGVGPTTRIMGMTGERVFDLEPANPANIGSTFNFAGLAIVGGGGIGPGAGINANNGNDHLAVQQALLENNNSTLLPGGAIHSRGPSVVGNSVIRNNTSSGNGGGLAFAGDAVIIRVDVFGSTISGNSSLSTSSGGGGGIFASTSLFVYNSTLFDNRARNSGGGLLSTTFNGRITLLNTTIAGNQADSDGTGGGVGGGLRAEGSGASSFNSVLAANRSSTTADDCSKTPALNFASAVANHLDVDTPTSSCGFATGNSVGVPAQLGPFADNGGGTLTLRPLPGSPLIDSGSNADCLSSDQRGLTRPVDGDLNGSAVCDKGAVEVSVAEADQLLRDSFE